MNLDLTHLEKFMKEENKLIKDLYYLEKKAKDECVEEMKIKIFRMTAELNDKKNIIVKGE